jgi:hypothetical protein
MSSVFGACIEGKRSCVVNAKRGLRDGRDTLGIIDFDRARLGHAAHQHHLAGRDAESALHFLVAGVADEDHGAALVVIFFYFEMDLGDQRAGGVDNAQRAVLGAVPFAGRDAVRAEDDALAAGNLVEALDENRAFLLERLEHEAVVHYLMTYVERTAVGAQRAADSLDGAIDARAKAARLGQDDLLNECYAQRHPTFVTGNCPRGQ